MCSTTVTSDPATPYPLLQSAFPDREQMENLKVTFSQGVGSVRVSGTGAIKCSGSTHGTAIAYSVDSVELGRADFTLSDSTDCSPESNPDGVTFGAEVSLAVPAGVRRIVILPPQPWSFPVGENEGFVTAFYTISFLEADGPIAHVRITADADTLTYGDTTVFRVSAPGAREWSVVGFSFSPTSVEITSAESAPRLITAFRPSMVPRQKVERRVISDPVFAVRAGARAIQRSNRAVDVKVVRGRKQAQFLDAAFECSEATVELCYDDPLQSGYEIVTAMVDGVEQRDSVRVTVLPGCRATVTSYGQSQPPWATDTLDHIPKTMRQRGCAVTSMASGLSALGTTVTPGALNTLLKNDANGYDVFGGIYWEQAARLPSQGSVLFERFTSVTSMTRSLCNGRPVIVGVKVIRGRATHFVLATEAHHDGSFQIMDPGSGSGISRSLSYYPEPHQIRGALRLATGGNMLATMGAIRSGRTAESEADPDPSFVAITIPNARIDVTDANGRHTIADSATQTMDIPGSTSFADALDDDAAPFEVDTTTLFSVSVPLGAAYEARVTPKHTGTLRVLVQATIPSGVQPEIVLTAATRAGVPFGISIATSARQATAVGSAVGFVKVNRSCGRTHTVTNSNSLPLDLTYGVEGESEAGSIHIDANDSVKLTIGSKGRILLFHQGVLVYRADVPPGCS